jgi:hypothetical protein
MQNLTPEGLRVVTEAAKRHGVSPEAAGAILGALAQGHGRQAQFNHPEFGGMGQWSQGGMIMIGDMFNSGLKARVDGLCNELAGFLRSQPAANVEVGGFQSLGGGGVSLFVAGPGAASQWWPSELGTPASTGAQNDLRYAYFPGSRRLAIHENGRLRVYDAGEHRISGFSQQQGGDRSLTFTSQYGLVRVADLPLVSLEGDQTRNPSPAVSATPPRAPRHGPPPAAPQATEDILGTIERLAELRQKDILTEEEFSAKKSELLSRL